MKRLFLFVFCLFVFGVVTSMAQTNGDVLEMIERTGGSNAPIWDKFIGDITDVDIPDLIDFSYSGYKNGEEEISVVDNTVYNVVDYGAIPSDGNSDTQAIRDAIHAARNGGIVFFPPGQYDVFMGSEDNSSIEVGSGGRGGVVLRGSGAQGSGNGGSTIQLHNAVDNVYVGLFVTKWLGNGNNRKTFVVGSFARGSTHFDVVDSSSLSGHRFILLQANNLTGSDWEDHCSVSQSDMPNNYTAIGNGVDITEIAEIDYIVGNTVYVKVPIMTPLNSNYSVAWKKLNVGMGAEDLHFDGGLDHNYSHLEEQDTGSNRTIFYWNMCAESWVRRCRFSNTTGGGTLKGSYSSAFIGNIFDGRYGHVSMGLVLSTRCMIALLEDHTNRGMWHGVAVSHRSTGCVVWAVGGPKLKGPDTHGAQPRISLFDNYYATNHYASGGAGANLPHHLDGYTRWNNYTTGSGVFDLWGNGAGGLKITQGNVIGYIQPSQWWPKDAYVSNFQSVASPVSLYLAQLERRLGYMPVWVDNTIEDFRVFRTAVINGNSYLPDFSLQFSNHLTRGVLENEPVGTNIGSVVIATNGIVDNIITYSLDDEVSDFEIDENSGQLTSAIVFDYELNNSYIVVVTASDSYGNTASVSIRINIRDVYEFSILTRTQQVQDAIVDAISGVNNVADVTEDHLGVILVLNLDDKGITTLKSDDFEGLILLQHLTLSNNKKLKTLPDDIFTGLTSLKTIGLHTIGLESLSGDVFTGLSSLTYIYLNDNKLENLDSDLFLGLTLLKVLQLNNNDILSVSSGIFKGLTSLKYLWLQGNNVDPLPLIVSLEKVGVTSVKAVIPTGAPFDIVLPVSVMNGNIAGGATTITISAGETESDEDDLLSVVRDNNTTDIVSIDIGVLPSLPDHHDGYEISKSEDLPLLVFDALVGAPTQVKIPNVTILHSNFPNPFNPDTWIPYQLSNSSEVSIIIYNSRGVVVRKIDMGMKQSGYYISKGAAAYWDGRNLFGESVSSGIYFYQMNTDRMSALKKMVILK